MRKTNRLKDRVRNAADPELTGRSKKKQKETFKEVKKKKGPEAIKDKPEEPEAKEEKQEPIDPEIMPPLPERQYKMKPFDEATTRKFARRVDNLTCVLITALVRTRRKQFKLTLQEMEAIEFGDSMLDIVNWYLPQLDLNSPWPPAVMAFIGLAAVVGSKIAATPKEPKKSKSTVQATKAPPQQPPDSKAPKEIGRKVEEVIDLEALAEKAQNPEQPPTET